MQFRELDDHITVNLQMSFLAASLLIHHPYQVAIPIDHLFLLFVIDIEPVDIFPAYPAEGEVISSDNIFHLPHIEQVFRNVCLA